MDPISLASRFSTPVLTRAFAPSTSPAGSALTSSEIAIAISCMVMSCIIRFDVGTATTVSGAANPLMVVRVTPAVKSLMTNSSANNPN